ncbi:MAG: hypothetical protein ACRCTY_08635, partial [Candidatus Adiutrix sp.]
MKLSTKIVMGFLLANFIFIVLIGAIYAFMRPIQGKSDELREYTMPLFSASADIRYNMSRYFAEVRGFVGSPTNDRQFITLADQAAGGMNEALRTIRTKFNSPTSGIIQTPEITGAFSSIEKLFADYQQMVLSVPERQDTLLAARTEIVKAHNKAVALLDTLFANEAKMVKDGLRDAEPDSVLNDHIDRMQAMWAIKDGIRNSFVLVLRGVLYASPEMLEESQGIIAEINGILVEAAKQFELERDRANIAAIRAELTVYQNFLNDIVRDIVASTEASRRRTGIVYEIIDKANILSGQAVAILADEAH